MKWGTVYFNPEHDFLHIRPTWSVKHTLFNFMYHLKSTYDPRGIGLLNLVITGNDITGNDLRIIDPSDPDVEGGPKTAFTQIIQNLREVIFYSTIRAGRQILGSHTVVLTPETIYNRSFPIEAKIPTFDRLPRDPRTIGEDLRRVFIGMNDHRDQINLWHQLLKAWDITNLEVEYKWHIAFEPRASEQIFDKTSANEFMQSEDNTWNGIENPTHIDSISQSLRESGYRLPVGAESERYKNEDLEAAVKPAFGFWLFPIHVLGPVQEDGVPEQHDFRRDGFPPTLWDFSKDWPELWVASLPDRV